MTEHISPGTRSNTSHGNVARHDGPRKRIDVRKVPASTIPFGENASRNGQFVWCAYDGDRLVAMAATAKEARALYRLFHRPKS
jgi:hypothetical protein